MSTQGAVKAKDDDGKYVYALPRERHGSARYNPYDLEVVSADEARKSSVYYTATASNINRVRPGTICVKQCVLHRHGLQH